MIAAEKRNADRGAAGSAGANAAGPARGGAELREDVGHLEPGADGLAPFSSRSSAWSASSSVSTPNATGTPVSSAASWSPDAASPATKSKCGVSPRMTQPSATMQA